MDLDTREGEGAGDRQGKEYKDDMREIEKRREKSGK
jgi:hypothetical protein